MSIKSPGSRPPSGETPQSIRSTSLSHASQDSARSVKRREDDLSRKQANMTELSSEAPTILVSGEEEERQQLRGPTNPSVGLGEEDRASAESETQAKMQSVLQQVRNQIRSQAGARASKSGILELMQRLKDGDLAKTTARVNAEGGGESEEPAVEKDLNQKELCEMMEKKLEAGQKALRERMEEQISRLREEMQTYTDKALKEMQGKLLMQLQLQPPHGPDWKQNPSAPPSLASRRGRVLTRTMTTIIPKTGVPVVLSAKSRSEVATFARGQRSQIVTRDPGLSLQGRKPLLPPANPAPHLRKKAVQTKAKTAK